MRAVKLWRKPVWMLAALLVALGGAAARSGPEKIVLRDTNGAAVAPLEGKDRKATVFIFITNDCPIANSYAPEISRICAAYAKRQIAFYIVYVDPALSASKARQHAKEYGLTCPALLDPEHTLVRFTKARVTPEAAVVAPNSTLLYRGRIDDRYVDFGKGRAQPAVRDLRNALDAILQGKPVPHPVTIAVGCYIVDMKK